MSIRTRNKISVAFSMSSMTDIVFLLLIFFMLTSTLVSPNALKLLLPNSSAKTLSKQTLSVSITEDLNYFVGTQQIELSDLESVLTGKITGDDDAIVLHVDRNVPIQHAVNVMDIANKLKVKIVLATKPD
jgi:biopolymer transport protein ExbD